MKRLSTSKTKIINRKRNYKTLITILESVDIVAFLRGTTTSETLSVTGFGLIVMPVTAGVISALSKSNKKQTKN